MRCHANGVFDPRRSSLLWRDLRQQERESWACPVERHEDQWILPTISIPLTPTITFFWERPGVENDAATGVLREAIAEAMRAKTDESPNIKSKMDDVAEAVAAVKRDLIAGLPSCVGPAGPM